MPPFLFDAHILKILQHIWYGCFHCARLLFHNELHGASRYSISIFKTENQNDGWFLLDKGIFLQYFRCLAASRQAVQAVFDFQRTSVERSLSMVSLNIVDFQISFVDYLSNVTL